MTRCVLVLLLLCAQAPYAWGVIISTGDGSGNTKPPADDPGFRNVGFRNAASAIYLGNRWVLTSYHVGAGPTIFDGVSYGVVAGSQVQLRNPTGVGVSAMTDLLLFQIDGTPALSGLNIDSQTPQVGTDVVMIGRGRDRTAQQLSWDINWKPATGTAAVYSGYGWLSTGNTMRWGTNVIDYVNFTHVVQSNSQKSFLTDFDASGTAFEAQGATGDSGGAVFSKDAGGHWQLSGLMFSINQYAGQPYGICAFGNATYSADLSVYRDQIYSYTRVPGDVTLDGIVDIFDVNQISDAWGTSDPAGDANYDGVVDIFDVNQVSMYWTPEGNVAARVTPEPASLALGVAGISLLACWRWRSLVRRRTGNDCLPAR